MPSFAHPYATANHSKRPHRTGHVYQIRESVRTPIEQLLIDSCTNLDPDSLTFNASAQSLSYLSSQRSFRSRKCRPCIIAGEGRQKWGRLSEGGLATPDICLMATFEGTDISKMPFIFQHFCIPVFPNDAIQEGTPPFFIRSEPINWMKQNVWVIGWLFQSTHRLQGRWRARERPYDRGFSQDVMRSLVRECESRKDAWREICRDKNVAITYANQYKASVHSFGSDDISCTSSGASFFSLDNFNPNCDTQSIHEVLELAYAGVQCVQPRSIMERDQEGSAFMTHLASMVRTLDAPSKTPRVASHVKRGPDDRAVIIQLHSLVVGSLGREVLMRTARRCSSLTDPANGRRERPKKGARVSVTGRLHSTDDLETF
ncbi:hypothetical protein FKP32DRAFT_1735103 [Trametes sanguinea]|nr:hypothetical protein FKP32DRAFT_1735103 [Trametes sanguinea]